MKNKQKKRVTVVLALVFAVCAVLVAVYLVAAGYVGSAIETILSWNEDGTLDAVGTIITDKLIPWLTGIGGAVCVSWLMAVRRNKRTDAAIGMLDKGTAEAVRTYGERSEMNATMQSFMERQTAEIQAMRAEQTARLDVMQAEQRASLAADRAAIRRIEGKVDGMRRMEEAAFTATAELVRKGTASKIVHIRKETEGDGAEEGGEGGETHGDDGEAVEDTEAHR